MSSINKWRPSVPAAVKLSATATRGKVLLLAYFKNLLVIPQFIHTI